MACTFDNVYYSTKGIPTIDHNESDHCAVYELHTSARSNAYKSRLDMRRNTVRNTSDGLMKNIFSRVGRHSVYRSEWYANSRDYHIPLSL